MVAASERGGRLAGVRISRVLAASIGLRRIEERVEDVVAINRLASGAVEVRMDVLGRATAEDEVRISASEIPMTAARNDRRNVSSVRCRRV